MPEIGYAYLDITELKNGVQSSKKMQPVIQKNGVILEYPENVEEDHQFLKIEQFTRIMKICKTIKKIEFFKNLHIFKYFHLWRACIKKKRLEKISLVILPKIEEIYNPNLIEFRDKIYNIKTGRFLCA